MYKKRSSDTPYTPYRPIQHNHWFARMLLVIGLVCLTMTATMFKSSGTIYASGPGGNVADSVVRAVDIAEPAVVRIFTTLGGHLAVHFSNTSTVTFPQGTGNSYPLELSGSGTFISAHGDILTADHVVNPPHDQSLDFFLDDTAASDVATYINQNAKPGSAQVTVDQIDQELRGGQLPSTPTYDPATSQVFLDTAYTGPLSAQSLANVPPQLHATVDRIEMESSFNEKDVAIIHVNINDMPSVQLGDSSNVQQQDQLTIIGFPGNGDVSSRPTDLLSASVNSITVSSIKTTDAGAQVIQVGGNVEHGDSGGPALDSGGAVVGIVSFGLSSGSPGATSFLQASNSARTLVQSLNLDTRPGAFQKAWSQAITDYAATTAGHWHKAEQELQKLATNYPQFMAVTPYLNFAQAQARTEKLPRTSPTPTAPSTRNTFAAYAWTIGGIILILLLIVLLVGVAVRQRRGGKKAPKQATSMDSTVAKASQGQYPAAFSQPGAGVAGVSAQHRQASPHDDGMTAFGAPPPARIPPPVQPSSFAASPPSTVVSGTLRPWPCGHMNRPGVNYCSICGEPAPPPPTSLRVEQ